MVALAVGTHDHVDLFLNGHKGYVFDQKTGQLRELRLGTATETAVERAFPGRASGRAGGT